MIDQIVGAANWAYRERFLTDKLGDTSRFWLPPHESTSADDNPGEAADGELDVIIVGMLYETDGGVPLMEGDARG